MFTAQTLWLLAVFAGAGALLGLSFKRMILLRLFLLVSCAIAVAIAWSQGLLIIAALFALATVVNLIRLFEIHNTSRRIRHIRHYGYDTNHLARYMKPVRFAKGTRLFEKGDPADRLYLIRSGVIGVDNGARVEADGLLGEVGLFTTAGKRSMGATAMSDVEALTLSAEEVSRLCLHEPEFSYALSNILANRMTDNMRRMEQGGSQTR